MYWSIESSESSSPEDEDDQVDESSSVPKENEKEFVPRLESSLLAEEESLELKERDESLQLLDEEESSSSARDNSGGGKALDSIGRWLSMLVTNRGIVSVRIESSVTKLVLLDGCNICLEMF